MKDLALCAGQSNDIAKRRVAFNLNVIRLEDSRRVFAIEKVCIGCSVEKIHRGKKAILPGETGVVPGIGVGVQPHAGKIRQEIGNIQRTTTWNFRERV